MLCVVIVLLVGNNADRVLKTFYFIFFQFIDILQYTKNGNNHVKRISPSSDVRR